VQWKRPTAWKRRGGEEARGKWIRRIE